MRNRVKGETDEHHSEEEFVLPGCQRNTEADGCAFAWQNLFILDSWVVPQPLELSACTHRHVWEWRCSPHSTLSPFLSNIHQRKILISTFCIIQAEKYFSDFHVAYRI